MTITAEAQRRGRDGRRRVIAFGYHAGGGGDDDILLRKLEPVTVA